MRFDRPYILPTRHGFAFLLALFFLFLMALSYGHSMAFAATFFLTSLLMSSALLTHLNLKDCFVSSLHIPEVFRQGELPQVQVELENKTDRGKSSIAIYKLGAYKLASSEGVELKAREVTKATFCFDNLDLGPYSFKEIQLMTSFPLGLFYTWMKCEREGRFYVAPAAVDHLKSLPRLAHETDDEDNLDARLRQVDMSDEGEFYEHRHFDVDSDSWHRLDWKVYAKKDVFLKKSYATPAAPSWVIDIADVSELSRVEAYEQLSFWLFLCESNSTHFDLNLKKKTFKNLQGAEDVQRALKALSIEADGKVSS